MARTVVPLTSAQAIQAGLKTGVNKILHLKSGRAFDVVFSWLPSAGGHLDMSPTTEGEAGKMYAINGGKWDWSCHPGAIMVGGQLIACGFHFGFHHIIIGHGAYPSNRQLGYGIRGILETGPPWTKWGGHVCCYLIDSNGGTSGCKRAVREAAGLPFDGPIDDSDFGEGLFNTKPLYDTHNTRHDATIREIGIIDSANKPSINTATGRPRLSVVNYTSMLSAMFQGIGGDDDEFEPYDGPVQIGDITGNARIVTEFLLNKGLNRAAVAGILGNIEAESGFNPGAVEGGGHTGRGICQWSHGRTQLMFNYLGGEWRGNLTGQLRFMWHEFETTHKSSYTPLLSLPDTEAGLTDAVDVQLHRFYMPCTSIYLPQPQPCKFGGSTNRLGVKNCVEYHSRHTGKSGRRGALSFYRSMGLQQSSNNSIITRPGGGTITPY